MGAGIGVGDEVILPANTFFATAQAVVAAGAMPVLADVDPQTAAIDPGPVTASVTTRTVAVVAVHLYGHPADTVRLRSVVAGRHLSLLEDAAQAGGEAMKHVHQAMGFNERMDEVQAAVLTVKLSHLDEDLRRRADLVGSTARYWHMSRTCAWWDRRQRAGRSTT